MGKALVGRIAATLLALVLVQPQAASAQAVAMLSSGADKGASSQSLLGRAARLDTDQVWLGDALVMLQRASGVSVAFSPTLIPDSLRVHCRCSGSTVEEALALMLDGLPFSFREVGEIVAVEPRRAVSEPAPTLAALVRGRVVEEGTDRPLQGAQVYIPGPAGGTALAGSVAGVDGSFRIPDVPSGTQTLAVRLIGYAAQQRVIQVPQDGELEVNFVLARQAISLDQVLVTGTAGRQELRAQGAAVASVSVGDVSDLTPVKSVTEVLTGRMPGISVTQGSGVSGSGQQIRIRGASSISLSNEPLVYVDGVRIDTKQTSVAAGAVVNPLNDIDPNEIQSIEIVKGPAAATLYGADASAGVIQIITKRGIAGSGFTRNISLGYAELQSNFTPLTNFAACRAQDITQAGSLCEGRSVGDVVSDQPMVRYGLPESGQQLSLNASIRGGGESYGFFSSVAIDQEEGLFPNNTYNRMSGRVNYNVQPNEKWRVEMNLPIMQVTGDMPVTAGSSAGWTTGGMAGSPLTVGTPTDGWFGANRTPDALASISHELNSVRIIPTLQVNWEPTTRFRNRVTLGADLSTVKNSQFFPKNSNGWYSATQNLGVIREDRRSLQRATLNYLGIVDLPVSDSWGSMLSFGSEIQADVEDLTYALGNQLTTNAARSVSAAAQVSGGQLVTRDRRIGFYAQWEPNWQEKLYLQFGLRADKFAAFGSSAPLFYSPSARVSYVISDEPFFNVDWINSLRVRGAFGTTGRAPTAGASLQTYSAAPYLTGPGGVASGIIPLNPGNPDLQAERGQEFELGADLSVLNERVGFELTFYNKTTSNLLLRVPQPPSMGYQEDPFQNIGKVVNRGLELTTRTQILAGERLAWGVDVSVSTLHNEIADLGGVAPFSSIRFGTVNSVREGRQVGAFYTNRIRHTDLANGVAVVSDSLEYVGNLMPTFEGNLASTLTLFRNLRLYAQLDMKRDFYIYNATAAYRERNFGIAESSVRRNEILSEDERLRRFGPYVTESGESIGTGSVLDPYLEKADFVRLGEVSLIYQLPQQLVGRFLAARSASITLSARNLAMWSDYSGFNPDVQNEMDALAGRADFFTLPPSRRLGVRFDLTY